MNNDGRDKDRERNMGERMRSNTGITGIKERRIGGRG
jgi:hypothetical protein